MHCGIKTKEFRRRFTITDNYLYRLGVTGITVRAIGTPWNHSHIQDGIDVRGKAQFTAKIWLEVSDVEATVIALWRGGLRRVE